MDGVLVFDAMTSGLLVSSAHDDDDGDERQERN